MRYYAILLLLFWNCSSAPENTDSSPVIQVFPAEYAKGFQFEESNGTRCLRLFDLESDSAETKCLICQHSGNQRFSPDTLFLPSEPKYATLSTTHLSYFWKLNGLSSIVGTAYASYVKNEEVLRQIKEGKIEDVSGEKEVSTEKLIKLSPTALITYPYGDTNYERLRELGVFILPFSEYLETHPLGRAEWIKVVGFLTHQEDDAQSEFAEIKKRYEEIKNASINVEAEDKPLVFTGSHSNGMWYAPPGNSYISQFIQDAGAKYLFEDQIQSSNLSMEFEKLIVEAMKADFWGKVTYEEGKLTLSELRSDDERYAALPCFKKGNVFYCNAAETDYFGDAIVEPDVVLNDLLKIFHPELSIEHQPKYFQSVISE